MLGLRGGGGPSSADHAALVKQKNALAAFFLTQGGDLKDVGPFVDKICKGSSPATVEAILKPKSPKEKLEAISRLAKMLNIPSTSVVAQEGRDKIRDRVKLPAQDLVASLDLASITVKDGFFLNEDGSSCPQRLDVVPQSSGVCLLDAYRSAPWLAHSSALSQDELAVVALGRCECPLHSDGKRIKFPAFCPQGEPLVLAGCLHNLGYKKVTTTKVDTNILTPDLAVVSFTICKDEIPLEKWDEIVKSPVKTVLGLCGGELTLLAPPWGRVFQRLKTKVPAEEATSLQFHARISKDYLTKVLQMSGTKAVYTRHLLGFNSE